MSEEFRFFLRIAGYTALIAVIYWFVSYEEAGSALLVGVFVSAVTFLLVVRSSISSVTGTGEEARVLDRLRATIGFREAAGLVEQPLELEEDVFPTGSIWPLALTLGVTLIALGLLYGPWLWTPGLVVATISGAAWLTQLR